MVPWSRRDEAVKWKEAEDSAWKEESAGIGIFKIGQTSPKLYEFK